MPFRFAFGKKFLRLTKMSVASLSIKNEKGRSKEQPFRSEVVM
jgi:hypothetical protein